MPTKPSTALLRDNALEDAARYLYIAEHAGDPDPLLDWDRAAPTLRQEYRELAARSLQKPETGREEVRQSIMHRVEVDIPLDSVTAALDVLQRIPINATLSTWSRGPMLPSISMGDRCESGVRARWEEPR